MVSSDAANAIAGSRQTPLRHEAPVAREGWRGDLFHRRVVHIRLDEFEVEKLALTI
jgi:hypothetical protein